jgi:hypothetical protein
MSTTTLPNVGDTVKAVTVPGMPEYNGKTCVLNHVGTYGNGEPYLRGEFQSRQKPDDTINFEFSEWEAIPGRIPVGATVRCTTEAPSNLIGGIGTVRIDDESSLPYYVTGLYPSNSDGGIWLTEKQVEVVADGETLTVSDEFKVGDYVEFSAVLTDAGIDDSISGHGTVIEAADGIYTVQTARTRSYVTGTGYVGRWESTQRRLGDIVTLLALDPMAPSALVGKTGVITGWHDGNSPYVTFGREEQQYLGQYPGAWVIGEEYLTEPASNEAPVLAATEDEVNAATERIGTLETQVTTLTRELERANERVEQYAARAGKWERDFNRYATRVKDEAIDREWCGEYERIMEEIKDDLEIAEIPDRIRLVQKRVRIEGKTYRDVTVWVPEGESATDPDNWRSSDDPDDTVSDDFVIDTLYEENSNNGWDETDIRVIG